MITEKSFLHSEMAKKNWESKLTRQSKSIHITFTTHKKICSPVILNDLKILQAKDTTCLGLY